MTNEKVEGSLLSPEENAIVRQLKVLAGTLRNSWELMAVAESSRNSASNSSLLSSESARM